jgi:drug/metabolite transporter (DMT)-like permease
MCGGRTGLSDEPVTRVDRVALFSFLGASVLAGGNGVSVRFSNRELAPLWGAGLRFGLAAAILLAVMGALRLRWPRGRALVGAMLFGGLNFGAAFALIYLALLRLHGGFGQVLFSLVPLFTLLLAVAWRQERFTAAALGGTASAVVGVAVLAGPVLTDAFDDVVALSVLALLAGAVCQSQALVLVRVFPPVHPVTMNAVGMGVGAVLLLAGSALRGEAWTRPHTAPTWIALGYLVLGGSVAAFVLTLVVLRRWSAPRASYMTVLIPCVTVVLSAWLDDEPLGVGLLLGGPLILGGVFIGAIHAPPRPARATCWCRRGRPAGAAAAGPAARRGAPRSETSRSSGPGPARRGTGSRSRRSR